MSSVLVTGASGFLGTSVVLRLKEAGHDVVGLDPAPTADPGRRHVIDDLSERPRVEQLLRAEGVSHVLHCGGISGPMVLADQPARVIDINVVGSINLLQASLNAGVKTFIYCSSVSAVGDFYETAPITDDYPLRPGTSYGCSKAAMDMVLRGLWKRVPLDLCSLRFTSIYGPGRQTGLVVDDIVKATLGGKPASVDPATDWPYIYIDDAADAVVAASFSTTRRQLFYFIAYPEQVSLKELSAAAEQSSGKPTRIVIDDKHPRAARGPLDISPAQRDFGFVPRVGYREGIRRMVDAIIDTQS
jgi:nucleoside-diphosphate-sugar epimerase